MKIALFSDVHGRLRVVLRLIRCWQMAHRTYLDGALIAGDLGCFPDLAKVDKATLRWMADDSEEAGFARFFVQPQAAVENMINMECGEFSDVRCPIYFIPGNHEDYDFLLAKRKASNDHSFTVDCYRRFQCIQDGAIIRLQGQDGQSLRVAGIWGIENTAANAPYKIDPDCIRQLEALGKHQMDVLLTHDAPAEAYPGGGSKLITRVIKACEPSVHLFGHVHPIDGQCLFSLPGCRTTSFLLKNVSFGKTKAESLSGSLGLLDWDQCRARVSVAQGDWLKQMRYCTWQQVWPGGTLA